MASNKNQEREAREARERLKVYNARQAVHSHQVKRRVRDNVIAVVAVLVVVAIAAAVQIAFFTTGPGMPVPAPSASASASSSAAPQANVGDVPDPSVAEDRTWTGSMTLNSTVLDFTLDGKAAPQAVASFVQDAENGYFDDTTCPRLVSNDGAGLLQCGSTDGTISADGTYGFGPVENAPADGLYESGVIAVARVTDNAYSQAHQFFIVFGDITIPDDAVGGYTVIGKVTKGIDKLTSDIVAGGIETNSTSDTEGAPNVATAITRLTIK